MEGIKLFQGRYRAVRCALGAVLCAALFAAPAGAASTGPRFPGKAGASSSGPRFAAKNCLDCHKKFADKYLGMKDVHAVVRERNCEACHLRHGIVPKLLLKKIGNEMCFSCHAKDKIGMTKANIHTALKKGQCTTCHDPHAASSEPFAQRGGERSLLPVSQQGRV